MAEPNSIEYRPIEGYPGYRVGNDGSVWFCWVNCRWGRRMTDRWKPMKQGTAKNRTPGRRYRFVNLTPVEGGKYKTFRVHRLVLLAFVGPCPEGMETRHIDLNPANNRLDNLAWGTPEQNRDDNRKSGRYTNTPKNLRYTHAGKTLCLKEWAAELKVNYSTLYQRIAVRGMQFDAAISRPFLGVAGNGKRH